MKLGNCAIIAVISLLLYFLLVSFLELLVFALFQLVVGIFWVPPAIFFCVSLFLAHQTCLFFLLVLLFVMLVVVLGGVLVFVLSLSCFQTLGEFQMLKILHQLIPRHLVDIDVCRQHRHLPFGWLCVVENAA